MSGLTYQQNAVLERLKRNNEIFLQLNSDIKGRANFLIAASTSIVGVITAAKFLPNTATSEGTEFLLLSLVCLCSIGIYWYASLIWKGGYTALDGSDNVDTLYDSYINKERDIAYCNMLSDLCTAFRNNKKENLSRGKNLEIMVNIFMAQLFFLALSVGWTSYLVLYITLT
jgi:hypothetical protein